MLAGGEILERYGARVDFRLAEHGRELRADQRGDVAGSVSNLAAHADPSKVEDLTSLGAAGAGRTPAAPPQATAVPSKNAVVETCIRGALLDPSNVLRRDWRFAWVRLVDSKGGRTNQDAQQTGRFEFRGLGFGTYWIIVSADGYRAFEVCIELRPEQPVIEKDLLLQPIRELLIRLSTPDGHAFFDTLAQKPAQIGVWPIMAVATLEEPGNGMLGLVSSQNDKFGVGHFWGNSPGGRALPPGYWASLYLDCEPPLWVSLVHFQSVLHPGW